MVHTVELDKVRKTHKGWHWLWSLCYLAENLHKLPNFNLAKIRETVPNSHWLKKEKAPNMPEELTFYINNLIKTLGNPTEISKINFSTLTYDKTHSFSNFIFPVDVFFNDAEFTDDADFKNTLFIKDAFFNDAELFNDAHFTNAKFLKNAFFNGATFHETADFEDAEFHENTSHYKETAKFRNTTFSKIANFRNAAFWGYANFKGSKLKGRAFFQDADFKYHAPRFYDATFNNEITWTGIKLPYFTEAKVDRYEKNGNDFKLVKCDECGEYFTCVKCEKVIKKNHKRRIEENQNSYENTSILLKEANRYHDQHFFFRQEMRCRRWLGSFFNCSMYWIYQLSADYGYGAGRALLGWFVHILGGALMLSGIRYFNCPSLSLDDFGCSLGISLSNSHAFFFNGTRLEKCYESFQTLPWFNVIWGVQTIMGTLLIFLVLLTLRVRFRLGSTTSNTTINNTIETTSKK